MNRQLEGGRGLNDDELQQFDGGVLRSQHKDVVNSEAISGKGSEAVSGKGIVGASLETLIPSVGPRSNLGTELWVAGPSEPNVSKRVHMEADEQGGLSNCMVGGVETVDSVILDTPMIQSEMLEVLSSPKLKSIKKWKRSARAGQVQPTVEGEGVGKLLGASG
ncbi:hypothetical protein Q3G72_026663 [Acer saccharum]|nr:hypothetical protein Q3G72_026663 [Acer saccharum]